MPATMAVVGMSIVLQALEEDTKRIEEQLKAEAREKQRKKQEAFQKKQARPTFRRRHGDSQRYLLQEDYERQKLERDVTRSPRHSFICMPRQRQRAALYTLQRPSLSAPSQKQRALDREAELAAEAAAKKKTQVTWHTLHPSQTLSHPLRP